MKKIWITLVALFGFGCGDQSNITPLLSKFSAYNKRFRFFFMVKKNWIEGKFKNNSFYSLEDESKITVLKDYVIAYRNGDVAHSSREFDYYPDEVDGLDYTAPKEIVFQKQKLETGNQLCEISFQQSPILQDDSNYYETKIKNISSQKFKIIKFGGFQKLPDHTYLLSTITNDFFSATDFRNWYMDNDERWIHPNQTVSDPINYGGVKNNWAYEIETESGDTLWISSMN